MSWQIKVMEDGEWQDTIWGGGWEAGYDTSAKHWTPPFYDINSVQAAMEFVKRYLAKNYPQDSFTVVWEHGNRRERKFKLPGKSYA